MVFILKLDQNHFFKLTQNKLKFFIEKLKNLNITNKDIVYDLYTGTGTITNLLQISKKSNWH